MPPSSVECWKTDFSLPLQNNNNNSDDDDDDDYCYQPIPVPQRHEAPHHFLHGHLVGTSGLVERYDLYRPNRRRRRRTAKAAPTTTTSSNEILVAVVRVGPQLSGYPGTLHGGATALLFDDVVGFAADEVLAQEQDNNPDDNDNNATRNANNNIVTAQLSVDYYQALSTQGSNPLVLIQVRLTQRQGRKIYCVAQMTNVEQTVVYAVAKVLYVIPRAML